MRKVTKILLRIVSAIVLLLIILPLLPALLLAIPVVQNIAIDKAAVWAGNYLGTTVKVGHITVGMFNRVAVRDFYVADLDGDTLLYVKRADAYFASLSSLVKKNLVINYGNVQGGKFVVKETTRGTFAVKEITDQLTKHRKKRSEFRLDIRSLEGSGIDFSLIRNDEPRDVGVDYANMHLLDINTYIDDFAVEDGAVMGDIRRLAFEECRGFVLDDLAGNLLVDDGQVKLEGAHLRTAQSDINLDYFLLDGANWLEYRDFINNIPIICNVSDSRVSSEDVGHFAPAIWGWHTVIHDASLSMNGPVADFRGEVAHAKLEDGGVLKGSVRVKGLIDVDKTRFDIKVDRLKASTAEVAYLLNTIAHLSFNESVTHHLEQAQGIDASGEFHGTIHDFKVKANSRLQSGGGFSLSCAMKNPATGRKGVTATLSTKDLNLQKLLSKEILGTTTFTANVDAEFGDEQSPKIVGDIMAKNILLNGCDFQNIGVVAKIENSRITGNLATNDKALMLDAQIVADLSDRSIPLYDADVSIEHADLYAMNINRRDTLSVLRGEVALSARGTSLDNLNGALQIANAEYTTIGRECSADAVELSIRSNEDARTLTLTSDFADALFESQASYKDVLNYLKGLLAQYVPKFYGDDRRVYDSNTTLAAEGGEVAVLSFVSKNIDPLLNCIADGLEMAEGSKLEMMVNPLDNRFSVQASSEYLMHHNYLAANIDLSAGNTTDSLVMEMSADDLYAGMLHLSRVKVNGGAKDNVVDMKTMFGDSISNIRGAMSARAKVMRKNNERNIFISLNPSFIKNDDTVWNITTDGIEIAPKRAEVRKFKIEGDSQEMFVDGVMSGNAQDSIYMGLRNFSISPITQLTSRIGYDVQGRSNGYATIHSALKDTRIDARIEVDSINVSGVSVPDVLLTSRWDFGRSRASLNITTLRDSKRVLEGFFAPSQMRYYARMQAAGVELKLLDPLLSGVITDTEGSAFVNLVLSGKERDAELQGSISVDNLATTIDYTRCRYSVPKATIKVENNKLFTDNVSIFDRRGREGKMSLGVSLAHLSNIEYNLGLQVRDMEVLNTTERNNPMFYGTIFATGTGSIRGDKAGVKMDFAARSSDNSKFYMPLTDDSNISSANFVTFATEQRDTTSYLLRKKMMFENKQKRRTTSDSAMDISLALDVRPNTEVQLVIDPTVGDIIKATGEGSLNLRINPQANIFEMYGDYTIQKGSYLFTLQNIFNKWFDIEPGSTIQWTGQPLDALLNIDAVYRLKASLQPLLEGSLTENTRSARAVPVECFIHLTDRLTQPTVTFDIVVPSADSEVQSLIASALATPESKSQQFLYLILANSFISESQNTMSGSIGASATAATGFELLSNQFSNWLSSDDYKIILRYRPRTEQMSDEVDFGFSKGLIDNRLLIEVEGNYIVDKAQVVNSNSNFTGEAYLTWLIDRAGVLRLKGFTHTIDRFDENQGLQETGVGIYFKEDFNNAKDLRYRLKNRFKRENKGERKAREPKKKRQTKQ